MWRSGGRGALRTWHNQFCLNCFNEETVCDVLDLVGPRRGLSVLTWWVLRYFCSHCKSVINMLPNGKMQKRHEPKRPVQDKDWNSGMLLLMWSMNRSKYIWWLTFPSIFHYAMLSICPYLACVMRHVIAASRVLRDLRGKDRWRGAQSSRIETQDVWLMKSFA